MSALQTRPGGEEDGGGDDGGDGMVSMTTNTNSGRRGAADRPISIRVREEDDEPYQIVTVDPGETILAALVRSTAVGLSAGQLYDLCGQSGSLKWWCSGGMVNSTTMLASDTGLAPDAARCLAD
jgi:hypothetical protein